MPLYNTRQMNTLPSVRILTLGKQNNCRVLYSRLTAKLISVTASSAAGVTWGGGTCHLCRVPGGQHSAKYSFAVCLMWCTRQRIFAECFCFAECLFYYTRYIACLPSARDAALGKPVDTRQQCGLW